MTRNGVHELTTDDEFREAFPVLNQLRDHLSMDEYLDLLPEMQAEGYRLFAYFEDGDIVGVVGWTKHHNFYSGPHVFVYDLVTDEDRRGEGIGTALLEDVHDRARQADCEYVSLESGLWRERAHEFYDQLGYEKFCYSFRKSIEDAA